MFGLVGAFVLLAVAARMGTDALAGLGIALGLSAFSLLSLRLLTTAMAKGMPPAAIGVKMTILTTLLKFPVLLVGIFFATRLPNPGLAFFLGGVALVYSAFVWFTASAG